MTQECLERRLSEHIRAKTIVKYLIPLKEGNIEELNALNWHLFPNLPKEKLRLGDFPKKKSAWIGRRKGTEKYERIY